MRNLGFCLDGLELVCDFKALSSDDLKKVEKAQYDRNLSACSQGIPSCQLDKIGPEHIGQVRAAQYASKFLGCVGDYQPYHRRCDLSALDAKDRVIIGRIATLRHELACAAGQPICKLDTNAGSWLATQPDATSLKPDAAQSDATHAEELASARSEAQALKRQVAELLAAQENARREAEFRERAERTLALELARMHQELDAAKAQMGLAFDAAREANEKSSAAERREREESRKLTSDAADLRKQLDAANTRLGNLFNSVQEAEDRAAASAQALAGERDGEEALKRDLAAAHKKLEAMDAERLQIVAAERQSSAAGEDLGRERERNASLTDELAAARGELEKLRADVKVLSRETSADETARDQAIGRERQRADALEGQLVDARREAQSIKASLAQSSGAEQQAREDAEKARAALEGQNQRTNSLEVALAFLREQFASAYRKSRSSAWTSEAKLDAASEWPLKAKKQPTSLPEPSLLPRARMLLQRGDIGAARGVLQRALDEGSAEAAFILAETYDEKMLSLWNVVGTQADAVKAHEIYRRAYAAGYTEAKQRLDSGDLGP